MRLSELLAHFQLETAAPSPQDFEIRGVRPLAEAGEGELSFLSNPKYRADVPATKASAILVKEALTEAPCTQILCPDPYLTLARVLALLYPEPKPPPGVHPTAVVAESARLGPGCSVGPYCVIGEDSILGPDCVLESHVQVGPACVLGTAVHLFAHVTLYRGTQVGNQVRIHANTVVGSDGFGYANDAGVHVKMPQIGRVRLDDHVEIGSNVSIDRGALADAIDGMLAREHDQASRLGAVLNELGDVVSDSALYLPLALVIAPGFPLLAGATVVVFALTEMAGLMGQVIGARRRYDGPFGKSDRALLFSVVAVVFALFAMPPWVGPMVVAVSLVLAVATVANRVRAALAEALGDG